MMRLSVFRIWAVLGISCSCLLASDISSISLDVQEKSSKKNNIEQANNIALRILNILPPEAQSSAGIKESDNKGFLIKPGYTKEIEGKYLDVLFDLQNQQKIMERTNKLLKRESELSQQIIVNYLELIGLNRKYKRLSIFLPFTYCESNDLIDPIGYIFDGLNQLILKNFSKETIGERFKDYVIGQNEMPPLILGAKKEIERLLEDYKKNEGKIIFPCKSFLEDIINPTKIKAIKKEISSHLSNESLELMEPFSQQVNDYVEFVKDILLPNAPEQSLLPFEIYQTLLKINGVNEDPQALIKRAKIDFKELYKKYLTLGKEVAKEEELDIEDPVKILQELERKKLISDPLKAVQLYTDIQKEIEEVIIKENIMTLPQRSIKIRTGTEAEETIFPVPHVNTPNFINNDGSVWPEFVLCDLLSHANPIVAYPLTVHEGRPGHDLQFSRMLENYLTYQSDLIQTVIASNSTNAEGWAHYVEYLMADYFSSKAARLAAIRDQLLRIARLFLDPELNTQKITYKEAKDFIQNIIGFSEVVAKSEADRYSFRMPGQATTYRYGALKIMDLRDILKQDLGEKFTLQKFHDAVISFGLLPIDITADLIKEKMLEE